MFLGHYGVALAAKRAAPRTSLGTLAFGAQWLDELWPLLLLAGMEQVRIVPGLMAASPLDFVHYPISHSLLMAALWGAFLGGAWWLLRRGAHGPHATRGAWVLGLVVLSHWLLDAPMHRPDLPLWPGSRMLVGFGAWNSVALTVTLELLVFGAGLAAYARGTRARDRVGSWGFWSMIVVLLGIGVGNLAGPPPPDVRSLALGALGLWLFVPWMWWVDAHREVVAGSAAGVPVPDPVGAA